MARKYVIFALLEIDMTTQDLKRRKRRECAALKVRGYTDGFSTAWVAITHKNHTELVRYAAFATDKSAIWSDLASKNLVIINAATKTKLVNEVEALEKFPRRVIFSKPGWCDGQFANASGTVFAPKGVTKGMVAFLPLRSKCLPKGKHRQWAKDVAAPLAGHPIPVFFIMAALAAPLLELSGRNDNIGFELAGEGGKGKTTVQRFMASVVGPAMEKDRGYITSFYMTPAALEQATQWHADMPLIIDEANLFGSGESGRADKRKMRDFSFQMSSGTTKGRFNDPQQEGFRFVYVTSANEPFSQLLDETHSDVANAASDRLISISVPPGDAGVFGKLPDGVDSYRQFTLSLETAMSQQFGTAMPKFLKELVQARHTGEKDLRNFIRRRIDRFKTKAGVNDNNGSDVRVAEAFGLVYAAGALAKRYGVLPKGFKCLGAALHCYTNFRSTVPIRQPLANRLIAIARRPETIKIDRKSLPKLSDTDVAKAGAFIRKVKGESLLLMTTAFGQKMFPDWNALRGSADFIDLNRSNDQGRGRGYHCRIRSNKTSDWFYCFKLPQVKDWPP